MRCHYCGAAVRDRDDICSSCGRDLTLAFAKCWSCGGANPGNQKFCGHCGAFLSAGPPSASEEVLPPAAQRGSDAASDRRQVTVLFVDLVGSTEISRRLDPEDLSELLGAIQKCCDEVITRFEGFTAQLLGDGILAYFGYPKAHEDDPERAVRAGLGVIQAMGAVSRHFDQDIALRVGIATGTVLTGNRTVLGGPVSLAVVGDTPNLAARLQGIARPNSVVVSQSTKDILRKLFDFKDLDRQRLKGFGDPVGAWEVTSERPVMTRFEALRSDVHAPLVGRREELALLNSRWDLAKRGTGQIVLLTGEAGIGKSRIIENFRRATAADGMILVFQCSSHYANSALFPVIAQMEKTIGLLPEDGKEARLEKLKKSISAVLADSSLAVPLFARLLSIQVDGDESAAAMSAQRWREATFRVLLGYLEALSKTEPLLVIVEDAHWIDPSTLELIELMRGWIRSARVLLIVTARPEFMPSWTTTPGLSMLTLNRLSASESATLVRGLPGSGSLPEDVVAKLCDRGDGVPLFIEELALSLLSSGSQDDPASASVRQNKESGFSIPATLQDSLMARLDMLGPSKDLAQIAAAIGRDFSLDLLEEIAERPIAELQGAMDSMIRAALIYSSGVPPHWNYSFKHTLVQDAAYSSLLRGRRKKLHGRIAEVLEGRFQRSKPELIAHHYTLARNPQKAIEYWEEAGRRALRSSADREAVGHFERATQLLGELPSTIATKSRELSLRILFGPAMINTLGPMSREVQGNYRRTDRLCQELSESSEHFAAIWGSWRITRSFEKKREIADQLLRLSNRLDDEGLRLQAHHTQWATLFHLGLHEECVRHVDEGMRLYRLQDYRAHASLYGGHDPKVCGCGEAAFSLWLMGQPREALLRSRDAMGWARLMAHAGSIAHALDMNLVLQFFRRNVVGTIERSEQLLRFAEEEGFPIHKAKGSIYRGWAMCRMGDVERGFKLMQQGLDSQKETGTREDFPLFYSMLAEVFRMREEFDRGIGVVDQGVSEAEDSGLQYWMAELYRCKGELLHARGDATDEAEKVLQFACRVASHQGASLLELRATKSLARLWAQTGRPSQARDILATTRRALAARVKRNGIDKIEALH
ncbi:MAG: adenylate/guanylate cyclase domain-containing protein [Kiloniellales bacterium]